MNIDTYINNINIYIHKYIGRGRGQLENQKCSNRTSEHVQSSCIDNIINNMDVLSNPLK